MPRDPVINAMLRDRVRAGFTLPFADPILGEDEFVEDTSEESIATFRQAGLTPTPRQAASAGRRAEQLALDASAPRPGGILAFTQQTAVAGSLWLAAVAGPVPFFPFLLDTLTVNVQSAAGAAGGLQSSSFALLISSTSDLSLAQLQADTQAILAGDGFTSGIAFARVRTTGQSSEMFHIPISYAVPISPAFLKFLWVPAANTTLAATVSVTQLAALAGISAAAFAPPVGRISINLNTQPTRTRGTRRSTPRAAAITVTQGGSIINSRTVAWESLAPNIRRDWFNRQVGGASDPNIRWIP